MALTGKKRVFADAVLAGRSNKDAAIEAGYSAATASAAGSRLVKEPPVAAYIASRRAAPATAPAASTKPPAPSGDEDIDPLNGVRYVDPKDFLGAAMNAPDLDMRQRIDCAKALMPFEHQKLGEGGKKEKNQEAAKTAAKGKFAPASAPKLVVSNK